MELAKMCMKKNITDDKTVPEVREDTILSLSIQRKQDQKRPGKRCRQGYQKISKHKELLQIWNCIATVLTSTQVQD